MYFKIPYDFMILRSVFTIRVWFACSVPCQNRDFDNLAIELFVEIHMRNEDSKKAVQRLIDSQAKKFMVSWISTIVFLSYYFF